MMRLLSAQVADGTEHENSTDEGVLASYVFPAYGMQKGNVYRITFSVRVIDNNSTDTLTIKVRVGTTTLTGDAVITTGAVDVADGDICVGWLEIVPRGNPSDAVDLVCFGMASDPDAAGIAVKGYSAIVSSEETNAAVRVELTADWSVAHADNEVLCDAFNVYEISP